MTPMISDLLGLFWGERGLIRGIYGMIRLQKLKSEMEDFC